MPDAIGARYCPLETSQINDLLPLMAAFYEHEHLIYDAGILRSVVEELVKSPELGGVWLIEIESTIAGYFVLTVGYSLEYRGRFGLLDEFYLLPAVRGRGFGRQALAYIDHICRLRGLKTIHLEADQMNTRALRLYGNAGFGITNRHFMTKWLE